MRIDQNLKGFHEAVQAKSIVCSVEGEWRTERLGRRLTRRLFGLEELRLQKVANAYLHYLDRLEQIPVHCNTSQPQSVDYHLAIATAKVISDQMKFCRSERSDYLLSSLKNRMISLEYRAEIREKNFNPSLYLKIQQLAEQWKAEEFLVQEKELTQKDLENLREACHYERFMEKVIEDTALRQHLFRWIFRYGNRVNPFVEFPSHCVKIRKHHLASRIGVYGGDHLKIEKVNGKKELTLPFEGKRISILDPNQKVTFERNLTVNIEEVFEAFRNKRKNIGNFEYFQDGVRNWNGNFLGPFDPKLGKIDSLDLMQEKWWEKLPLFKELDIREANERYGITCDGKQWVFTVKATRNSPKLTWGGQHGYLELAIPTREGKYRLYHFGKHIHHFPIMPWEYIPAAFWPNDAVIMYPDENEYYRHRQHTGYSVLGSEAEGVNVMQSVREDMLNARDGNFVFQLFTNNCCHWVWNILRTHLGEERIPCLFNVNLLDTEPSGIAGKFLHFLRGQPEKVRDRILSTIAYVLGSWKSRTVYRKNGETHIISMYKSRPWGKGKLLMHPSYLFRLKELGIL